MTARLHEAAQGDGRGSFPRRHAPGDRAHTHPILKSNFLIGRNFYSRTRKNDWVMGIRSTCSGESGRPRGSSGLPSHRDWIPMPPICVRSRE